MVARRNVDPGTKFGLLTFVAYEGRIGKNRAGRFFCECGNETVVSVTDVKSGHTKSCGCAMPRLVGLRITKHGHARGKTASRAYMTWCNMIARCTNPNRDDYERYGAAGVTVCDAWRESFENFYADMGDPPPRLSIDRIDGSKGYSPDNCRWATVQQQNSNQRSNINIEYLGKVQNLAAWARELDLSYGTVKSRVRRGETDPAKVLSSK